MKFTLNNGDNNIFYPGSAGVSPASKTMLRKRRMKEHFKYLAFILGSLKETFKLLDSNNIFVACETPALPGIILSSDPMKKYEKIKTVPYKKYNYGMRSHHEI